MSTITYKYNSRTCLEGSADVRCEVYDEDTFTEEEIYDEIYDSDEETYPESTHEEMSETDLKDYLTYLEFVQQKSEEISPPKDIDFDELMKTHIPYYFSYSSKEVQENYEIFLSLCRQDKQQEQKNELNEWAKTLGIKVSEIPGTFEEQYEEMKAQKVIQIEKYKKERREQEEKERLERVSKMEEQLANKKQNEALEKALKFHNEKVHKKNTQVKTEEQKEQEKKKQIEAKKIVQEQNKQKRKEAEMKRKETVPVPTPIVQEIEVEDLDEEDEYDLSAIIKIHLPEIKRTPKECKKVEEKVERKVETKEWKVVGRPLLGFTYKSNNKPPTGKTNFCRAFLEGKKCRYGNSCLYAHSFKELVKAPCGFATCLLTTKGENGIYYNCKSKICMFWHKDETNESFLNRNLNKNQTPASSVPSVPSVPKPKINPIVIDMKVLEKVPTKFSWGVPREQPKVEQVKEVKEQPKVEVPAPKPTPIAPWAKVPIISRKEIPLVQVPVPVKIVLCKERPCNFGTKCLFIENLGKGCYKNKVNRNNKVCFFCHPEETQQSYKNRVKK